MHVEDKRGEKRYRRWKWSHVATFPECRVSVVGMLQGTWSTPLTQLIAKNETKSREMFTAKKTNYLSVGLCSHGCSFAWFFHRGFLFSSGFGDVSSHASGATKEPNRWNDWTKTASFLPKYSSQARTPPSPTGTEDRAKPELTAKRRAGVCKMWQRCRRKAISPPKNYPPLEPSLEMEKLAPPQMRCGVQRPSPLMNGHPGYDDRARAAPPITSPEPNERGRGGGGGGHGVGGERGLWTMGDTTTTRHNFFWGFHLSKITPRVDWNGRCLQGGNTGGTPKEQTT